MCPSCTAKSVRLDDLEEGFAGGVVIAITLTAHRYLEPSLVNRTEPAVEFVIAGPDTTASSPQGGVFYIVTQGFMRFAEVIAKLTRTVFLFLDAMRTPLWDSISS